MYVCLCVCLCVCVCPVIRFNGSPPSLEETFYWSWHVTWAINFVRALNARACACVLNARACVNSLIFERILSKFAGNILRLILRGRDYILFIFTHRMHACIVRLSIGGFFSNLQWTYYKSQQMTWATYFPPSRTAHTRTSTHVRVRAWSNVVKHSLNFGRILSKFAGHILQMTIS
jgi:hypothetical protein